MKIEKQKLINIIREELVMLNEIDVTNLPELEGVELGPGDKGGQQKKKQLGLFERPAIYDAAMGLGRAKSAMIKLKKAKLVSQEEYETVKELFDKLHKLWADSY